MSETFILYLFETITDFQNVECIAFELSIGYKKWSNIPKRLLSIREICKFCKIDVFVMKYTIYLLTLFTHSKCV